MSAADSRGPQTANPEALENNSAAVPILPRRIGASVESELERELWRLVVGDRSLRDFTPALQAWWTIAYEEGRRSSVREAVEGLRFSRDLWYFVANNPGKTPADYYARCTDALWSEAVTR